MPLPWKSLKSCWGGLSKMRIFNREFSGYALVGILAGVYLAFAMVTGFVTTGHDTAIASESAGEHAVVAEEHVAAGGEHQAAEALHQIEAEEHEGFGEGEPAEHGGHGGQRSQRATRARQSGCCLPRYHPTSCAATFPAGPRQAGAWTETKRRRHAGHGRPDLPPRTSCHNHTAAND